MSKLGVLGDALGQVGSLGKQVGKQVAKTPADLAKTAKKQIGSAEQSPEKQAQNQQAQKTDHGENSKQVVDMLYGKSSNDKHAADTSQTPAKKGDEKSPEEQQALDKLRQELHQSTYYQPLITRQKTQEEVERPAERVERKTMEELQEKKKKEEKKKPLQVQQAQNVEKFRGVSG